MIKGIIFDADGTLLDSMYIWNELGKRYLAAKGIAAQKDLDKILYPMTLEQSSIYLKDKYFIPQSSEEIRNEIIGLIFDFYKYEVGLKNGVLSFLRKMKAKGLVMGIATSGDKELLEQALKRLGVYDYFSVITTCTEFQTSKNNPLIYIKTAQILKVNPDETVVFEDVLYGIEAARRAGFLTVAVKDLSNVSDWLKLKECADYYISDFYDDILKFL